MMRFLKPIIFSLFVAASLFTGKATAGITSVTLLDSLDLSEFNTAQRTMLREELKAYTEPLDALAKTDFEEWKRKVNELLYKIRDGFAIYKLARDAKIDERIQQFENDNHVRVYILTFIDDSFLNNIFYRLAEAFYETTRPFTYVIFKFRFGKPSDYTATKPSFYLKDHSVLVAEPLQSLFTPLYASIDGTVQNYFGDKTYTDATTQETMVSTMISLMDLLGGAGIKGVEEAAEVDAISFVRDETAFPNSNLSSKSNTAYLTRSCEYITFTVNVTDLGFDNNIYLSSFNYNGKRYTYCYNPKVVKNGNQESIGGLVPSSSTTFLPFDYFDQQLKNGTLKGVTVKTRGNTNTYVVTDESWYFKNFTTQSCTSLKGFETIEKDVTFTNSNDCESYTAACRNPDKVSSSADFSHNFVNLTPNRKLPGGVFSSEDAAEIETYVKDFNSTSQIKLQLIATLENGPNAASDNSKIESEKSKDKILVKVEYNSSGILTGINILGDIPAMPGGCFDEAGKQTKADVAQFKATAGIIGKPYELEYLLYKAFFNLLYCYTSEQHARRISTSYGFLFAAGALNALIQEIDIIGAAEGVLKLADAAAKAELKSYTSWAIDMISLAQGDFSMDNKVDLLKKLMPPSLRFHLKIIDGVTEGVIQLGEYLYNNADNPYAHGMVIVTAATIYIGGVAIINSIKRLKLANKLPGKFEKAIGEIADAENKGYKVANVGDRTVILDGNSEVASISKNSDGTEILINRGADVLSYLKSKGYSLFEQIDNTLFIRDQNGKIGKIIDQTKPDNITWFTPQAGGTWQVHQINCSNYLKFKYGSKVAEQLKVRIYNKNGTSVDCYLDNVVYTSEGRFIISDAKHSQKAAIVDGQTPGYTKNQTQGYQWIIDGNVSEIEVIGDKGINSGINRGTDLLLDLDGKVRVLTNNINGEIVETSILRTK